MCETSDFPGLKTETQTQVHLMLDQTYQKYYGAPCGKKCLSILVPQFSVQNPSGNLYFFLQTKNFLI